MEQQKRFTKSEYVELIQLYYRSNRSSKNNNKRSEKQLNLHLVKLNEIMENESDSSSEEKSNGTDLWEFKRWRHDCLFLWWQLKTCRWCTECRMWKGDRNIFYDVILWCSWWRITPLGVEIWAKHTYIVTVIGRVQACCCWAGLSSPIGVTHGLHSHSCCNTDNHSTLSWGKECCYDQDLVSVLVRTTISPLRNRIDTE